MNAWKVQLIKSRERSSKKIRFPITGTSKFSAARKVVGETGSNFAKDVSIWFSVWYWAKAIHKHVDVQKQIKSLTTVLMRHTRGDRNPSEKIQMNSILF